MSVRVVHDRPLRRVSASMAAPGCGWKPISLGLFASKNAASMAAMLGCMNCHPPKRYTS
jgi:hypothetical protein